MTVSCSYCGKRICVHKGHEGVSHGICGDCLPKALKDSGVSVREFLEAFSEPALLVDATGSPVATNLAFKKALAMSTANVDVFLKGKKGSSEDSVQTAVTRSLESGDDLEHVSATVDLASSEVLGRLNVLIGTLHVGDRLIVKVEKLPK